MFKLEVGKSYVARDGEIVEIKYFHPYADGFQYGGGNGRWYRNNGSWFDGHNSPKDLVSEAFYNPVTDELNSHDIKHSHYKKDVSNMNVVDIYDVLHLFEVQSHQVGHAIKKLLMAGKRGAKGYSQDIQEAIDSLNRELEMTKGEE